LSRIEDSAFFAIGLVEIIIISINWNHNFTVLYPVRTTFIDSIWITVFFKGRWKHFFAIRTATESFVCIGGRRFPKRNVAGRWYWGESGPSMFSGILRSGRLKAAMEYLIGSETHSPHVDHVRSIFGAYSSVQNGRPTAPPNKSDTRENLAGTQNRNVNRTWLKCKLP
jgi:hypothetical protein